MTVTLYARPDIREVLIADGVRTWIEVRASSTSVYPDIMVGPSGRVYEKHRQPSGYASFQEIFSFVFAGESAAMAFRLRYADYLVDSPRHPDCAELMALEAA